jgi:hypothetical protein
VLPGNIFRMQHMQYENTATWAVAVVIIKMQ